MKVTVSAWQRVHLGIGAALSEPWGIVFILFAFFIWGLTYWDSGLPLGGPVAAATTYLLIVGFAAILSLDDRRYPWYLAWKASQGGGLASYWFYRFSHRIVKFVRRNLPSVRQDLLIKNHALQLVRKRNEKLASEVLPTFTILDRTITLTLHQIRYLLARGTQATVIMSHIDVLNAELEKADTFLDGYLRYLITSYYNLPSGTRALVNEYEEPSLWKRMELYPGTSKLLVWLFVVIVGTVLFFLFGESIPFFP